MWAMIEKFRVNSVDMAKKWRRARRENAGIRRHGTKNPGRNSRIRQVRHHSLQNSRIGMAIR
jgi:hypothetical protein